jgi:hypothetical protein
MSFELALERIDAVHAEDPGKGELPYALRMTAWVEKLEPNASEALRLAVRCQHLRRWALPRSAYPEGRAGYLRWRKDESLAHAALAGELLQGAGYDAATIARVQSLVKKERIKQDPEAQLLEDAAGLVFLEFGLAEFASRHEEAKVIDILQKTWTKMSARGQQAARGLGLSLLERALKK